MCEYDGSSLPRTREIVKMSVVCVHQNPSGSKESSGLFSLVLWSLFFFLHIMNSHILLAEQYVILDAAIEFDRWVMNVLPPLVT